MKLFREILASLFKLLAEKSAVPKGSKHSVTLAKQIVETGYKVSAAEALVRGQVLRSMREDLGDSYELGVEVEAGEESDSWDCSEKVEDAFCDAGMEIPDGSYFQYDFCTPVVRYKPCDLGFLWSNKYKRIGHVFMLTERGTVIHAVGGRGVVEEPADRWLNHKRFRGVRRHPDFLCTKEDRMPSESIDIPGLDG